MHVCILFAFVTHALAVCREDGNEKSQLNKFCSGGGSHLTVALFDSSSNEVWDMYEEENVG